MLFSVRLRNRFRMLRWRHPAAYRFARRRLFFILALLLLVAGAYTAICAGLDLEPYAINLAKADAATETTALLNRTLHSYMETGDVSYNKLCSVICDASGVVRTISVDAAVLNRIKAEVSALLLASVPDSGKVSIPVGTLTGSDFLSGRGFRIPVRCLKSYRIETDVASDLSDAGNNQTRHRLLLRVQAEITVMIADRLETVSVAEEVCLAETVIVGEVPMIRVR